MRSPAQEPRNSEKSIVFDPTSCSWAPVESDSVPTDKLPATMQEPETVHE